MAPRIGIIGAGVFGTLHLRVFSQLLKQGHISGVAFADLDPEVVARQARDFGLQGYTSYQAMFAAEHLDAVTVVTPDYTHRQIVLDALAAGCHVLVEKPMDVTIEGCIEMTQMAERQGRLLQVDFHKRFDPYHIKARQMVERGEIGAPQYGYAWMEDRIEVPRDWFKSWVHNSSPAWFLGIHMYDLLRWVTQAEVVSVYATGTKRVLAGLGLDTYDAISAHLNLANGACLSVDSSWILPMGFESVVNQGFRLVGDAGLMEVDSQHRGMQVCTNAAGMGTPNQGFLAETQALDGSNQLSGYGVASLADFVQRVDHVRQGGALADLAGGYADGWDGLAATAVAVAVHESVATAQVVQVNMPAEARRYGG